MDKFGVMAKAIICKTCDGSGQVKVGKRHFVMCPDCRGSGRRDGATPNPEKEAEMLETEIKHKGDA